MQCLDVGQSTGGFSDCLRRPARRRWSASRSGTTSFIPPAQRPRCSASRSPQRARPHRRRPGRGDARVSGFELIVCDASFISLALLMPQWQPCWRPAADPGSGQATVRSRPGGLAKAASYVIPARFAEVEARIRETAAAAGLWSISSTARSPAATATANFRPRHPRGRLTHKSEQNHAPNQLSIEFFPKHPKAPMESCAPRAPSWRSSSRSFLGHLRCGRLDPGAHLRDRLRDPARRPRSSAPTSPRRIVAQPDPRYPACWLGMRESGVSSPCAVTCPPAWSIRESCAMPTSWSNSSAPGPATSSTSRWRLPRNTTPQARSPRDDLQAFKRKGRCECRLRDHPVFLQCRRLPAFFATNAIRSGIVIPVVPGIMPIVSFSKAGALLRYLRRDSTLDAAQVRSFGDDSASIKAFGLDVVTDLCESLIAEVRPACISIANQAGPVARSCSLAFCDR